MERVLAGWFAEGTSYLSNVMMGGSKANDEGGCEGEVSKGRTTTNESGLSCTSSTSHVSTSSSSSRKVQKVMSWMIFGSKKIAGKKTVPTNIENDFHQEHIVSNKKSALDILLSTNIDRGHDIVDPHGLQALSVIGRGGYGKVMLMKSKDSDRLIAVKEVQKSSLVDKPSTKSVRPVSTKIEHAEMECLVLKEVSQHPFITTFHGASQTREKLIICMEYCGGGELFTCMQKHGVFSEIRTRLYVAEIVSALEFLHDKGIIYRDLKPENILLDQDGHIRLADFGLSIQFNKKGDDNSMRCYSICGTPEYIAPEIILMATKRKNDRNFTYGKTVDWWALGILTYEMLFRVPPFYNKERKIMLNKILACELNFPTSEKLRGKVSDDAIHFISALLKFDEKERLGFGNNGSQNVKNHPFFSQLDFEKVSNKNIQPEYIPEFKHGQTDTTNFDANFTNELLGNDKFSPCKFNLELTGYDYLPETFDENVWYANSI